MSNREGDVDVGLGARQGERRWRQRECGGGGAREAKGVGHMWERWAAVSPDRVCGLTQGWAFFYWCWEVHCDSNCRQGFISRKGSRVRGQEWREEGFSRAVLLQYDRHLRLIRIPGRKADIPLSDKEAKPQKPK